MSTRAQQDFLKVQLLETQRLRRMAEDDPLMALSLDEREQELQEQLRSLDPAQANEAYGRAAGTRTTEEPIKIRGIFKGLLLESWKFDFIGDEERGIGGRIDESLTEEEVIKLNRKFFNERCVASLLRTTVLFKNGRVRTTYILKGLEAPESTTGRLDAK